MVVGDSWALFSWTFNSYNEGLDRYGMTDVRANSAFDISIAGARAESYFSEPSRKQGIIAFLSANPGIEYCHISLGGNDLLGEWNKNMSTTQVDSLLDVLMNSLKRDIDTISAIKPGLTFVLSGYDYPNFVETAAFSSLHPYYDQWTDMGQPNALEINTMLSMLSQRFSDSSAVWNNVFFVNNNGLMQWTYGQTSPLLIPPYITYPEHSVPLPGGDMNYPSPRAAMALSGTDSFHLSDESFEYFIRRHIERYFWKSLRSPDTTILANDTALNGFVSAFNYGSDMIKTGKTGNDDVHGIITFNTSELNQSFNIKNASIFLKRQNLSGTNLINQELTLEIKSGFFGASLQVENDDFSSSGDISSASCTYGTVAENGCWMRIDIPVSLLPFINNDGFTQFKIKYAYADNDNYFEFYNSNDSSVQAFLDVKYDFSTRINCNHSTEDFFVHPNPASEFLYINIPNSAFKNIKIDLITIEGSIMHSKEYKLSDDNILINISNFPNGFYLVKIQNKDYLKYFKVLKAI
jgi:hypothetical protein